MPQVIRNGHTEDSLHQQVSTPTLILAVVVVLVFLVFMVDRFVTPIVPRRPSQQQEQEAWQRQLQRMQESMPQGGWASPVPGMPPVYVPPKGQPVENVLPPR